MFMLKNHAAHNIFEGRKMIEAARKYNVRLQVGFQNRSGSNLNEAMKFLHDGGIGEVYMARGLCINPRDSFGIAKDSKPPANLHYDLWLGPAPWRQYNEKRVHYNWHWFWATGCGDTGNQGPHQFDVARWGMSKNEHPVSVYATGGIYGIDPKECAQETPNTQTSVFKYKDGKIIEFETRGRYSNSESSVGILSETYSMVPKDTLNLKVNLPGHGKLFVNGKKYHLQAQKTNKRAGRRDDRVGSVGSAVGSHWANLIDAIRSGKDEDLNCDIIEGHYSCALPHLANISYRLGRELKFMGDYEKFADDPEADTMLSRKYRRPFIVPDEV